MPFFGVPIRNGLPIGLGSVAGFGVQQFDPSQLFAAGEQGTWYDPSDLSTLFTDSAGTTPVTGVEQVVGLMLDKSQGLVLGSELITPAANRDFSSDTGYWTKETGVTISGGTANWSATANSDLYRLNVLTVGKWYRITWTISSYTSGNFRLSVGGTTGVFRTAAGTYTETYYAASNGTFAITGQSSATGSVDNISVRELPGNHATASAMAKPTLSARYNLLTYSEEFDNGAWLKTNSTITANQTTAPDGTSTADLYASDATNDGHYIFRDGATASTTITSGVIYTWSVYLKKGNGATAPNIIQMSLSSTAFASGYANFNISLGTVLTTSNMTGAIVSVGSGWYRCSVTATATATSSVTGLGGVAFTNNNDALGRLPSYADATTSDVYIWGAQLLTAADAFATGNAYQRIAAATVYDTSNSVWRPYLAFGGTQAMSTGSIDFTATDKMTVFFGLSKLGTTAFSYFASLSAAWNLNNGTFVITAPESGSTDAIIARGTSIAGYIPVTFATPATYVLDASFDIGASTLATRVIPRINTVVTQTGASGSTLGTGNFGNHSLFIGARNNASNYFTGRLYSLITRGAQSTAAEISATESWVNQRTGAY